MLEIYRIEKSMKRKGFLSRILGNEEYEQLKQREFPPQSVAGNFCAKEAFSKAVGTGFRGIKLKEIQIIRDDVNKPFIKLSGIANMLYGQSENKFCVSITHTKGIATAIVAFVKEGTLH